MGIIADRRNAMTIKVVSPDGRVGGKCGKDRNLTSLEFRPGSYARYTEEELEHQLAAVLKLLAEGYEKAWEQILIEAGRRPIRHPSQVDQEVWKKYLTELPKITVVGAGPEKNIRFKTMGRVDYKCRLADGVINRIPEHEFAAQAVAASADLMRKFHFEMMLLKDECWGLDVPELTKERLRRKKERSASG